MKHQPVIIIGAIVIIVSLLAAGLIIFLTPIQVPSTDYEAGTEGTTTQLPSSESPAPVEDSSVTQSVPSAGINTDAVRAPATPTSTAPKTIVPKQKPTSEERANILHDMYIKNTIMQLRARLEQQFDGRRYPATLEQLQVLDGMEITLLEDFQYETMKNGLHYRLCGKLLASTEPYWCVTSAGYEE